MQALCGLCCGPVGNSERSEIFTHHAMAGCAERQRMVMGVRELPGIALAMVRTEMHLLTLLFNVQEYNQIYFTVLVGFYFYFVFVMLGRALHKLTMHTTTEATQSWSPSASASRVSGIINVPTGQLSTLIYLACLCVLCVHVCIFTFMFAYMCYGAVLVGVPVAVIQHN